MKKGHILLLSVILLLALPSCQEAYPVEESRADIVFMGDSITHLTPFVSHYSYLGKKIVNIGVSGNRVVDAIYKLPLLSIMRPRTVLVLIGVNNSFGTLTEFEGEYTVLLEGLSSMMEENGGFIENLYIETVMPVGGDESFTKVINPWIEDANTIIKRLAGLYPGMTLLDIHPYFEDEEGLMDEKYAIDGVHLSPLGMEHWYSVLEDAVPELLGEGQV